MKKIFVTTFIFAISLFCCGRACAYEIITLDTSALPSFSSTVLDTVESDDNPVLEQNDSSKEQPVDSAGSFIKVPKAKKQETIAPQEPLKSELGQYNPAASKFVLFDAVSKAAKDVYNLEIERTDVPSALFKDYLTWKPQNPETSAMESVHIWTAVQQHFSENINEEGSSTSKYDVGLINVLIDGKFKEGKESFRIMLDPTHRSEHLPFMQTFFQDMYFETKRIPHTSILVGNSRPGVGIEGAQSPYTLAFINRSQISRNLSNIRKFGIRVRGNYSLMDYDAGVYSSSTNFSSFFPGHELDAWMNLKPLGKTDGRYGKLVTGAGVQSGQKHGTSYYLTGTYLGYEYKKFWTKFEYARANGSNGGSGLTNKHSQGLFWTAAYRLTKKLEVLARFDHFDPDREIKNNNRREYTLGANYYVKGQALKLIFNYIYCQNDSMADSHRLMIGSQFLL